MVEKTNSGYYQCEVCGRMFSGHKRSKSHERLCGIDKISGYVKDVQNVWNLNIPKNKDSKTKDNTRQLSIGEEFLGYCSKCDARIVSKDSYKDRSELFKCPTCGKINTLEN